MQSTDEDLRYRELKQLGSGGMATVTLAEDTLLCRRVALKRVRASDDPREHERLRREALVGASLNHRNLVSVYDVQGEDDGELVIVMEYVAGETLRDAIRAQGALHPRHALVILEQLAAGLEVIHARGIVHRDVKPANVLLGTDGAVKLADLGIAAVPDRTQTTAGVDIAGTFSYMAPEQLEGRASTPAVDIYALAAVAFEMLSGRRARPEPNPVALAHAIATHPTPDLREAWTGAPAAAADVLTRGMAADPRARPASASALVARLREALDPQTTQAARALDRAVRDPAVHDQAVDGPAPVAAAALDAAGVAARRSPRRGARAPGRAAAAPGAVRGAAARTRTPRPAPRTPRLAPPSAARGVAQRRDFRRRRAPLAALLGLAVVLGLVAAAVATLGSGGGTTGADKAASAAHKAARAHSTHASAPGGTARTTATSTAAGNGAAASGGSSANGAAAGSSANAAATSSPSSAPAAASGAGAPAEAVQAFYGAAARHDYAGAWSLADANMRSQLAGYEAFRAQQSAVRSITFHRAQTIAAGASSATVALETTAVLDEGTEQCAGTARLARAAGGWMLDGISINCVPSGGRSGGGGGEALEPQKPRGRHGRGGSD